MSSTVRQRGQLDSSRAHAADVLGPQVGDRQPQVSSRQMIGQNARAALDEQRVHGAQCVRVQRLVLGRRQQQRVEVVQVEGGWQPRHRAGEGGRWATSTAGHSVRGRRVLGVLDDHAGGGPAAQRVPRRGLVGALCDGGGAVRRVARSVAAVAAQRRVRR